MTKHERLPEASTTILRYLRILESESEGYEIRGVRGWARPQHVERQTGVYATAEVMRQLALSGRALREEVRLRNSGSAAGGVWVYRITDESARLIDELDEREHVPVQPPGDPVPNQAYVSSTAAAALDALRHAAENPGRTEWVPGERGWRTSRELSSWLKAEGDREDVAPRVFFPGDLRWLVDNKLAVRRDETPTTVIYRITTSGAALQPVVWHGPEPWP
jgi:hypothetical protein